MLRVRFPWGPRRGGSLTWRLFAICIVLGFALAEDPAARPRGFRIDGYEVRDGSLDPRVLETAMAPATGTNVTLAEIRSALLRLRDSLRAQGYPLAAVTLPRQPLTNGIVVVEVRNGPAGTTGAAVGSDVQTEATRSVEATPPEPARRRVPGFDIRHFVVRGNTALSAEVLDELLGPASGSDVTIEELSIVLRRLRDAYRAQGYPSATILVPQQVLTDGTVSLVVREGRPAVARTAPSLLDEVPEVPKSTTQAGPTFEVRRFEVLGNTVLRPEMLQSFFTNAVGPNVTLPQIQKALGDLQMEYRERGYATVSVGLPQQQLADGVVKVQVTEGLLTDIRVTGNRRFSSNNVMRALPSLRTNALVNSRVFQRELDQANQNRDRQIYPTLGPGPDPGTSSLELRVKDRLPLHARMDVDNYATPRTPMWRINASAQYNNLWQLEHQVGISYGFSPQQYKDPSPEPDLLLNRPLISFFSAYYRLPLGGPESVDKLINASTTFGYSEATRQFVLPPAGSRPELIFFGSAAPLDTGVQYGPEQIVTQTPLLTIVSQDTGQNLTWADNVGTQYSHPWVLSDTRRLGAAVGLDWKRFVQESFNTNNFTITTVVTNSQGSQTIVTRVSSPQPSRRSEVTYLPLNAGGNFSMSDRLGTLSGTLGMSANFVGNNEDFQRVAGARRAKADYGRGNVSLVRDQKLPGNWSLLVRGSGQGATGPLIGNEQFSVGGINSVRGYFEGEVFGDSGWFASGEIRSPFLVTTVPAWSGDVPAWIRGSFFIDSGQAFLVDRGESGEAIRQLLWGAGFGVSVNVNQHAFLRFALAWPFVDTLNVTAGDARAYVTLEGQF
ncbi:MAG: BamA/TamA family outer membrane protein [Verrucomicrobiae bacterium]|nr:BamA/TamA family outer membrane protein [Verrucomicrobiae bacterium]